MPTWQCVKNCGACCQLDPADRPDLANYLTPADLQLYLSLVGSDGWCRHYDQTTRECTIYQDRPDFCRVTAATFHAMFGISAGDLNDFAIDCCQQQIEGVYGDDSEELAQFNQAVGIDKAVWQGVGQAPNIEEVGDPDSPNFRG